MTKDPTFRTSRLSGTPPRADALALYQQLFAEAAQTSLARDMQDWDQTGIAPWILSHAGHDVAVGGFRTVHDEVGLEIMFHFIPDVWGQGLASEFLNAALDHGRNVLRQDHFFGLIADNDVTSEKMLVKAGFVDRGEVKDGQRLLRLG